MTPAERWPIDARDRGQRRGAAATHRSSYSRIMETEGVGEMLLNALAGVPAHLDFTMTYRITSLIWLDRFVDEQERGQFRSFHLEHTFALDGERGVMVDTLTIASPIFGSLAERAMLVQNRRRLISQPNRYPLDSLSPSTGTT